MFFEDFPEFREGFPEGDRHADYGVESRVDGEPVIFGGFAKVGHRIVVAKVLLARVLFEKNGEDGLSERFENGGFGDEGGAGLPKRFSDVAVDVRDGGSVYKVSSQLLCIEELW